MLQVGDQVVYPMHGAGEIAGIEECEIMGQVKQYFILQLPVGDIRIMIPTDNADGIGLRQISPPEMLDRVAEVLLITHAPPYGILDQDGSIHYGSNELLSRVTAVRPRIHLFGHIHKANGLEESGGTVFSNAAMMDEHYGTLLEPHLINL